MSLDSQFDFSTVTEIEGQHISAEQLNRICHRYHWAAGVVAGKDVLEVACGAGQGLGLLAISAKSLSAGDISSTVLAAARKTYGTRINLLEFGAEHLPFADESFDVVLLFEAIYYIDADVFMQEVRRVLRKDGRVLIVTANPALPDFNPSPFSKEYFDSSTLCQLAERHGFMPKLSGYIDVTKVSYRQKLLRPLKRLAIKLNLMPKTMRGKALLKRLFFGTMTLMPGDITSLAYNFMPPATLVKGQIDNRYKVIYCDASKNS